MGRYIVLNARHCHPEGYEYFHGENIESETVYLGGRMKTKVGILIFNEVEVLDFGGNRIGSAYRQEGTGARSRRENGEADGVQLGRILKQNHGRMRRVHRNFVSRLSAGYL